jgi:hypothetical protein
MRSTASIAASITLATLLAGPAANAQTRVEVGILNCSASSSTGYIIASTKYLRCHFKRSGRDEYYRGTVSKFGIDIGSTKQTAISWAVLAPTSNLPPRSLNGNYGGVGAEATVGLGVGANALLGGSSRSIILQPLSVQAQKGGFNLAAGVQSLELRADTRY